MKCTHKSIPHNLASSVQLCFSIKFNGKMSY